jgi:hypothetical protein
MFEFINNYFTLFFIAFLIHIGAPSRTPRMHSVISCANARYNSTESCIEHTTDAIREIVW